MHVMCSLTIAPLDCLLSQLLVRTVPNINNLLILLVLWVISLRQMRHAHANDFIPLKRHDCRSVHCSHSVAQPSIMCHKQYQHHEYPYHEGR